MYVTNAYMSPRNTNLPIWTYPLRDWQQKAFNQFIADNLKDYLVVATPGAGKTTFALRIGHDLLKTGQVDLMIIVCPSDHLRNQWAEAAHGKSVNGTFYPFGLNFMNDWTAQNGSVPSDVHGLVLTFQQVASPNGMEILRWLVNNRRVFVVFDEVHHAGEDMPWGDALWRIFDQAVRRLCISGTPFRHDNNRIPFIAYDDNHRSKANFAYNYADALRDSICRPVIFPTFEGEMAWYSRTGEYREAVFQEILNEVQASERLRTALSPSGNWLPAIITDAHQKLTEIRSNGHARAGGLIVAIDHDHALSIKKRLLELTGIDAPVATSKDPNASRLIKDFEKGDIPWIVAIRMISEGVDIPRIRVVVFATNITTELFFRQVVGRAVRVEQGIDDQTSYFYMPSDKRLIEYAQRIKEEVDHVLMDDDADEKKEVQTTELGERQESLFMPITATAERGSTIFDSDVITPQEYEEARRFFEQSGAALMGATIEMIAKLIKQLKERHGAENVQVGVPLPTSNGEPVTEDYNSRRKKIKDAIKILVGRYAGMTGREHKDINYEWIKAHGKTHSESSEEDLQAKKEWLTRKIEDWINGRR